VFTTGLVCVRVSQRNVAAGFLWLTAYGAISYSAPGQAPKSD